ncbi:MAG: DPP IV N-terminal domain-containing protein, partial [Rikenellaceae bacterium]
MKKIFLLFLAASFSLALNAQNTPIAQSNYELPARYTPEKMRNMVFSTSVSPNFLKNGKDFWYTYKTSEGSRWYIVDGEKGSKTELFDNASMAAQISEIMQDPYDALHLQISNIRFAEDAKTFIFEVVSSQNMSKEERADYEEYRQVYDNDSEKNRKADSPMRKTVYLEYDRASGKVTELEEYRKPHTNNSWASISPDGECVIFARNNNIYWMDKESFEKARKNELDSTIVEYQITHDGIDDFSWSGQSYEISNQDLVKQKSKRSGVHVVWAPDSKNFLINRTDNREVKELWVINSLSQPRPTLETYKYHMPGESEAPISHLYLFNTESKEYSEIDVSAFKDQTFSVFTKSTKLADASDLNRKPREWLGDDGKFYINRTSRDLKRIDICVVDITADSLKALPLVEERMNTSMETRNIELINGGKDMITWSERSGWAHLYLYDANSGELKNQITSGDFHTDRVVGVDEQAGMVYFIANGYNKDENPYYSHLFKVSLQGGEPVQLTETGFDNGVVISDDCKFFVSNFSRVDTTPESVLYNNKGQRVKALESADLSKLFESGYKFPETFTVKAGDGVTDLYGVMYKPFDFDSTKLYPIIEYVYPGPQTEAVNTRFAGTSNRIDRLAQFGFIVITVGNRGG